MSYKLPVIILSVFLILFLGLLGYYYFLKGQLFDTGFACKASVQSDLSGYKLSKIDTEYLCKIINQFELFNEGSIGTVIATKDGFIRSVAEVDKIQIALTDNIPESTLSFEENMPNKGLKWASKIEADEGMAYITIYVGELALEQDPWNLAHTTSGYVGKVLALTSALGEGPLSDRADQSQAVRLQIRQDNKSFFELEPN